MLMKPGSAPELSWGLRGVEVTGLSLRVPSGTFYKLTIWVELFEAAQSAHVGLPYPGLECESKYTRPSGRML